MFCNKRKQKKIIFKNRFIQNRILGDKRDKQKSETTSQEFWVNFVLFLSNETEFEILLSYMSCCRKLDYY